MNVGQDYVVTEIMMTTYMQSRCMHEIAIIILPAVVMITMNTRCHSYEVDVIESTLN